MVYKQRGSASAVDDFMARMLLTSFMARMLLTSFMAEA